MFLQEYLETCIDRYRAKLKRDLNRLCKDLLFPSESDYPLTYFELHDQPDPDLAREWADGSADFEFEEIPATIRRWRERIPWQQIPDIEAFKLALPSSAAGETRNFQEFSQRFEIQEWMDPAQKKNARRFQKLARWFEAHFQHLQVYRVGEIEIQIYILGFAPELGLVGIQTISIET